MKVERAKMEGSYDKDAYSDITKQFTATHFVDQVCEILFYFSLVFNSIFDCTIIITKYHANFHLLIDQVPEKDNAGNVIPDWKRQMLAKKAAERAKKDFEERMTKEAEDRRLSAIPQWKRDLLARK